MSEAYRSNHPSYFCGGQTARATCQSPYRTAGLAQGTSLACCLRRHSTVTGGGTGSQEGGWQCSHLRTSSVAQRWNS
eukprot:1483070-Amphidinium_carterae.1